MEIIDKLAIKLNLLIKEEYNNKNFVYAKASYYEQCQYNLLFATQYKLSIMAMDLKLLRKLIDFEFKIDIKADEDLNDLLNSVMAKFGDITLNNFLGLLHEITKVYAIFFKQQLDSGTKKLDPEVIDTKILFKTFSDNKNVFFKTMILGYIATNLIWTTYLRDSYSSLAHCEDLPFEKIMKENL